MNVVDSPPSSAVIGAAGGVLASEIGSVISIPPGALPDGTSVSVDELSQEEVTTQNNIQWEAMGVTFLGAQAVQTGVEPSSPLGVSSAGFGNRVQPGQVVVNYRIMPDVDGDGVDEIIVLNTASVAPNNDVISDPISQAALQSTTTTVYQPGRALQQVQAISGPPGTRFEISVSGFNPLSVSGNLGIWTSSVNGQVFELPGYVYPDPLDESQQIFVTLIPPLAAGGGSLLLRNESTSSTVGPIAVTITAPPALIKPAGDIIGEFTADTIAYLQAAPTDTPEQQQAIQSAVNTFTHAQTELNKMLAETLTPAEQQALDSIAQVIQSLDIYSLSPALAAPGEISGGYDADAKYQDFLTVLGGVVGIMASVAAVLGTGTAAAAAFAAFTAGAGIGLGLVVIAYFICKMVRGGSCFGDPPSPPPGCQAAPGGSGSGTTGMGSAPPPGGNGCGNVGGGAAASLFKNASQASGQAGRFFVKLFSGSLAMPFTGMTDAGGYFFVPLIPEGEPFTALAVDTQTGDTRSVQGVGPALGDSTLMYFDFFHEGITSTLPVQIGDVISSEISTAGEIDLYIFDAPAGAQVFFDVQQSSGLGLIGWQLTDQIGAQVFRKCLGCGDPGVYTLAQGGTYLLSIGEGGSGETGPYRVQLWDVPAPHQFTIAVGDVISNSNPGPGAGNIETPGVKDIYNFTAAAGQTVFFDVQAIASSIGLAGWQLVDASHSVVFDKCLGCGDPGLFTLSLGGAYTLTVGENREDGFGAYRVQLWNVPAPDQFTIFVGDVLSNSIPGPGAGNIENPGARDVYNFTAAAGQKVFFDVQDIASSIGLVGWQLVDANQTVVFDKCLGCGDPGVYTMTLGGAYTLTVGDKTDDGFGTYRVQLWNVPAPDQFNIAIGDTVSDGVPGPGAGNIESPGRQDIYTFSAAAGQTVLFDILSVSNSLGLVSWKVVDANGTVIFNKCLGCGDPGAFTLALGGVYTIIVGKNTDDGTGAYQFQITNQ